MTCAARLAVLMVAVLALALRGEELTLGASPQFGELPADPLALFEYDGVRVEIVTNFVVPIADVRPHVPVELNILTVKDVGSRDSGKAEWLRKHPARAENAESLLGFVSLNAVSVQGQQISDRPVTLAFWWVNVFPNPKLATQNSGELESVELALWTDSQAFATAMRKQHPTVFHAPVVVSRKEGAWNLKLPLPGGGVSGTCTPTGDRRPNTSPGWSTVWAAGKSAQQFTLYTYYGHHDQDCTATWNAEGEHPLAKAIRARAEEDTPHSTGIQDGWRARAGVYRRGGN